MSGNIKERFEAALRHRRLHQKEHVKRSGPSHLSTASVHIRIDRADGSIVCQAIGRASKTKVARRRAMEQLLPDIIAVPDPCLQRVDWLKLWRRFQKPVTLFKPPPNSWHALPQILGIDFEGSPPVIVQVASVNGVAIDRCDAAWVQNVLGDQKHTHAIFGDHEAPFVTNPLNVQYDGLSLTEIVSRTFFPKVRIVKDKSIHSRIDWAASAQANRLVDEAVQYAALDAEMTRRLGIVFTKNVKV